nr:PREDICTED: uncharacterized protein LOC109638297 [Paralichthys olivaceus]XP_019956763.1 PREDICTED: uncharacterized protein LOC109638297 [Paralichthys olivaceus]
MPFTDTTMNITSTTNDMNITNPNSTTTLATTKQKGGKTTEGGKTFITSKTTSKTTSAPNKRKNNDSSPGGYDTGMYVIISIIIVAVGLGVVCYVVRNRGRRQSVDFMSRHDEANVPLSIMDHEPVDTISQNGLQTFETTAKEPQEPETKPEGQLDQKRDSKSVAAEADKSVVDPSAESAAAAPSPHDSEDKPKEDVAKPSPTPAPVQPSLEEKTDDEGADSNKTSVESLKETNENNSNNAVFRQKTDLDSSIFWAVPLDSPV